MKGVRNVQRMQSASGPCGDRPQPLSDLRTALVETPGRNVDHAGADGASDVRAGGGRNDEVPETGRGEPPLSPSQRTAYDAVLSGQDVLVTGPGGTGKSFLVERIIDELRGRGRAVAVTASTGVAGLNVGGSTVHSFLGTMLTGDVVQWDRDIRCGESLHPAVRRRLRVTKTIVVDEVSMLTGDYLDMMDAHLRWVCDSSTPWANKQMVFVGDFLQLPPVTTHENKPARLWAFNADAWHGVHTHMLVENHRQTSGPFLDHLGRIRVGVLDGAGVEFLQGRVGADIGDAPLKLYTTNRSVDAENAAGLRSLGGRSKIYRCRDYGSPGRLAQLKRRCLTPAVLTLRVGAKVMLTRNKYDYEEDARYTRFVNGDRGTVVRLPDGSRPESGEAVVVELDSGGTVRAESESWDIKNADGDVLATMVQYPVRLAYALTVHKSQGMSLSSAVIDLGRTFAPGQAYVALSRLRTAEGLSLAGKVGPEQVWADEAAVEFYAKTT